MYENIDDNGQQVTLRKQKRCEWCGEMIWVGQTAVRRVYKMDDEFNNARMHPECYIAMQGSYIEGSLTDGFEFGENVRGKTVAETEELVDREITIPTVIGFTSPGKTKTNYWISELILTAICVGVILLLSVGMAKFVTEIIKQVNLLQ
jgi:hypothetical protein